MSLNKLSIITAGLFISFSSAASNISFSFNNDNIDLGYDVTIQKDLKLKGDYLQTIDNGFIVDTGLYAFQNIGSTFFEVGVKGMVMNTNSGDGYALAFGGLGGLKLTKEFSLETGLHFSPKILAFDSTENYVQWIVRANYSIMPAARIFIEYNHTTVAYKHQSDERLVNDVLFGMKWIF